jgi:hypothetical protein
MTSEIVEELGWPWRTAYEVLNGLADDGEIRKKKPPVYCREAGRMSPWILSPFSVYESVLTLVPYHLNVDENYYSLSYIHPSESEAREDLQSRDEPAIIRLLELDDDVYGV